MGKGSNDPRRSEEVLGRSNIGRPREWTSERVDAEVTQLAVDGFMPSTRELRAAGHASLASAIGREPGGTAGVARRLGLQLRPGQDRAPFTEERARREAAEVIAQLGYFPGQAKMRLIGRARLATAVEKAGGTEAFARQLGLENAVLDGRRNRPRRPHVTD